MRTLRANWAFRGRARVQALVSSGVIELFGAVINPEKLGKVISTFVDIRVAPAALEALWKELADCHEVVSLCLMSDLQGLHVHALTDSRGPPLTALCAEMSKEVFSNPPSLQSISIYAHGCPSVFSDP